MTTKNLPIERETQYIGWLILALAVVVGGLFWYLRADFFEQLEQGSEVAVERVIEPTNVLRVGEAEFEVVIRDTPEERAQGLSGVGVLAEDQGMLFVFEVPQQPMFWMKDMLFDLDMVWINEGEVVAIDENVPAPTVENPRFATRTPPIAITQVLELAAGVVEERGLEVGDEVQLLE